jgi:hypothetical protein
VFALLIVISRNHRSERFDHIFAVNRLRWLNGSLEIAFSWARFSKGKAVQMKSDIHFTRKPQSLVLAHFFYWSVRRGPVVCTRARHIFSSNPK